MKTHTLLSLALMLLLGALSIHILGGCSAPPRDERSLATEIAATLIAERTEQAMTSSKAGVEQSSAMSTSPTPTPWRTIAASLSQTPSPIPSSSPLSLEGTPLPEVDEIISPENLDRLVAFASWGKGSISNIALSPDSSILAVATSLGVYLYSLPNYEMTQFIPSPEGASGVCFSSDSRELAFIQGTGAGYAFQTWNLIDDRLTAQYKNEWGYEIEAVAYSSSDQAWLTYGGYSSPVVQIWEVDDDYGPADIQEAPLPILALHPARRGLLAVIQAENYDQNARVWDIEEGIVLFNLNVHAVSAAFSPGGQLLALGSRDSVSIWDLDERKRLITYDASPADDEEFPIPYKMALSPDGSFLVWADHQGSIIGWEWKSGEPYTISQGLGYFIDISSSADGETWVASQRQSLITWQRGQEAASIPLEGFSNTARQLVITEDREKLVTLSGEGNIQVRELSTGLETESCSLTYPRTSLLSPAGQYLAAASDFSSITLYSVPGCKKLHEMELAPDNNSPIYWEIPKAFAFSGDERLLAVGTEGGNVWLWNTSNGEKTSLLDARVASINLVAFSPDQSLIAFLDADSLVHIWSMAENKSLHILAGGAGNGRAMRFSSSGTILASAFSDGTIWLWDVETGNQLQLMIPDQITLWAQFDNENIIAFSPDDRLLVSLDHSILYIWDVENGELLKSIHTGDYGNPSTVIFSPGGELLFAALYNGTIQIWGVH